MRYPIGMVWDEAEIVIERVNAQTVTEAVVMQATIASVLSKQGGQQFNKLLKRLSEG